jgi:hypothetical protein
LLALGFLALFLELALIRFLAGNVWNLGYFPNLVLLAVFVGMGVGFVLHGRAGEAASRRLLQASAYVLLALGAFVHFLKPPLPGFGTWGAEVGGEVYYTDSSVRTGSASVAAFLVWFPTIVLVFALIAQRTAKMFRLFPPLTAYTLDISGSCLGILAFMAVSWLRLPAWSWFAAAIGLFAVALEQGRLRTALPLVALVALAHVQDAQAAAEGHELVRWSPYQKVELVDDGAARYVYVNGIGHQTMVPAWALPRSIYRIPHLWRERQGLGPPRSVLVIGAGTGNDVAAALQSGALHVDAVEIDPVIAGLGRDLHPARAYSDPRVELTVTDGRAFLNRTRGRYDLILFALTDSLVKVSPMAQLRLENFLFTRESLRRAFGLLTDHGHLVLYNHYRRPWVVEKNRATVREATGRAPLTIFARDDFAMLLVGPDVEGPPVAASGVDVTTDDWPFPYLQRRGLPTIYLKAMACVLLLIVALAVFAGASSRRAAAARVPLCTKLAFLLMGSAFLLLETKGVIQFSVLFGTTWLNNSLVFLAVLVLVLVANWTALAIRDRRLLFVAFGALMVACLLPLGFPLSRFLDVESAGWRFLLAGVYTFSPVFFANVMFSVSFRDQEVPENLFGWNLMGAALGGVLEYASMALGYNALGLVVAACYAVAFGLLLRTPTTWPAAATAAPAA